MENVEIHEYNAGHQSVFERLNRAWIEQYFAMEPLDFAILQNPDLHIISKGGSILMAKVGNDVAGTVALRYVAPGIFEFTKMAVDEKHQGKKVGLRLAQAAIRKAKQMSGHTIFLYSNTKLEAAIHLYRKLGFREVPVDGPYKRVNIKMELKLIAL
jgi:ribosomal protein S18 acetylase RimI-like enzyme